ncbi:MAG: hypothetical protein PHS95_03480 [Candidatus Pacebacteria bacterium]|nr:hypothetical protein [Candidatus Paceibacterota bacterium]
MFSLSPKEWERLSVKLEKAKKTRRVSSSFVETETPQEIERLALKLAQNSRSHGEAVISLGLAPKGGPAEKKAREMCEKYNFKDSCLAV